MLNIFGMF
jgi:hypothetical protein